MNGKSQPSRRASNAASPHPRRPYKALLIRAQSPEPAKVKKSRDREATGSQMKSRNNTAARKAPYKALLIRARSPEPTEENLTDSEATVSSELQVKPRKNAAARKASKPQEPESGRLTIEEPNKKRRLSKKNNNAREGTMSREPEGKEAVAKNASTEEP